MARIPNLNDRNLIKRETVDGEVLRIENEHGETMVFTPHEAKTVLKDYIHNELGLESRKMVDKHRKELNKLVKSEMVELNQDMTILLHNEVNKMVEKIIHSVMEYNIEAEVNKRVEERLNKLMEQFRKG